MDDLIEHLARAAGFRVFDANDSDERIIAVLSHAATMTVVSNQVRRFAALVADECRAAVREVHADADEASNAKDAAAAFDGPQAAFAYMAGYQDAATDCDEAIRAKFKGPT